MTQSDRHPQKQHAVRLTLICPSFTEFSESGDDDVFVCPTGVVLTFRKSGADRPRLLLTFWKKSHSASSSALFGTLIEKEQTVVVRRTFRKIVTVTVRCCLTIKIDRETPRLLESTPRDLIHEAV